MKRTVVFDLGGVVVRINRTWQAVSEFVGAPIRLPADRPLLLWESPAFAAYQEGRLSDEDYHRALGHDLGVGPEEAVLLSRGVLRDGYAGAFELVQELHANGIQTGCLSNTVADHWIAMVETDDYPHIRDLQVKLPSHLVGLAKPDPAIYRLFEERAGASGADIAFFDDLPENVAAASELRWQAFLIDPYAETVPQMRARLTEIEWL